MIFSILFSCLIILIFSFIIFIIIKNFKKETKTKIENNNKNILNKLNKKIQIHYNNYKILKNKISMYKKVDNKINKRRIRQLKNLMSIYNNAKQEVCV